MPILNAASANCKVLLVSVKCSLLFRELVLQARTSSLCTMIGSVQQRADRVLVPGTGVLVQCGYFATTCSCTVPVLVQSRSMGLFHAS